MVYFIPFKNFLSMLPSSLLQTVLSSHFTHTPQLIFISTVIDICVPSKSLLQSLWLLFYTFLLMDLCKKLLWGCVIWGKKWVLGHKYLILPSTAGLLIKMTAPLMLQPIVHKGLFSPILDKPLVIFDFLKSDFTVNFNLHFCNYS